MAAASTNSIPVFNADQKYVPSPTSLAPQLEADKNVCLYFAIGSMMNPTSLALREIFPKHSWPAELFGYELVFRGVGGMASVEMKESAVVHGVLHALTSKEMDVLDKLEMVYNRVPVDLKLYDGTKVKGGVYQMDLVKHQITKHMPPSERYLDIIRRGAVYYGIKKEFVEWLNAVKYIPRKDPKDFNRAPDPPKDGLELTSEELAKYDGNNGSEVMAAMNGKLIKFVGDLTQKDITQSYEFFKKRYGGKDGTFQLARGLYDPKYSVATSIESMSDEHKSSIEDMWMNFVTQAGAIPFTRSYAVVGRLVARKPAPASSSSLSSSAPNGTSTKL